MCLYRKVHQTRKQRQPPIVSPRMIRSRSFRDLIRPMSCCSALHARTHAENTLSDTLGKNAADCLERILRFGKGVVGLTGFAR